MTKRLCQSSSIAVVAALLLVTTATVSAQTQDGAAPQTDADGFDRCPQGYFCAFSELDGQGAIAAFRFPAFDLRRPIAGLLFDNTFSSVWNRTGSVTWWLYPEPYFRGEPIQAIGIDFRGNLPHPDIVSSLGHAG